MRGAAQPAMPPARHWRPRPSACRDRPVSRPRARSAPARRGGPTRRGPRRARARRASSRRRPFSVSSVWRQRTGLHSWADSSRGHSRPARVDAGVDVGDDRDLRRVEVVSPSALRRRSRAAAMSGVWKAPPTGIGQDLRAPISLAMRHDLGHRVDRAGDDDLARRVVVGDPDVALGERGRRSFDVVVVHAEHGGHRARVRPRRPAAWRAPLGHEPEGVLVVEGAGGHEGGVLAEAVAGASRRARGRPARRRRARRG